MTWLPMAPGREHVGHACGPPTCLLHMPPPWAPWDSPGDNSDVEAGLAPGVHEGQQPPLQAWEAIHVTLHEVHLVLEEQRGAHLQGVAHPQAAAHKHSRRDARLTSIRV